MSKSLPIRVPVILTSASTRPDKCRGESPKTGQKPERGVVEVSTATVGPFC